MRQRTAGPPRLARALLRLLLHAEVREVIEGDLEEMHARMARGDRRGADRRYWSAALSSIVAQHSSRRRVSAGGWGMDVRLALRRVRSQPGFTLLAALTLALGIGANTAVFSVVNEALLREQPGVAEPGGVGIVEFVQRADPDRRIGLLPQEVEDVRAGLRQGNGLAAFALLGLHVGVPGATPVAVNGQTVIGDYFELLGVRAAAGRLPAATEMSMTSNPDVVVISERLWSTLFDRTPAAIGRVLRVNQAELVVIGVAGGGFRGVSRGYDVDAWVPASALPLLFDARDAAGEPTPATSRLHYSMQAVLRVAAGSTFGAAAVDLERAFHSMAEAAPPERELTEHRAQLYEGIGLEPSLRARAASSSRLLLGVVALVLIIACANVANLLLFRAVRRRGEVAVRRALGASTLRVVRQHLTESVLLALIGGVAGLLVAWALAAALRGSPLIGGREFTGLSLDAQILAFTLLVSLATVVLSGLLPALLTGGAGREHATLRQTTTRTTVGKGRLRSAITVLQLGLSLSLVVGALLVTRTVRNLHAVELGFEPERLWTARLYFYAQGLRPQEAKIMTDRVLAALRATPQVEAAGASTSAPFWGLTDAVRLIHPSGNDTLSAVREGVTPGYFETLGVSLVQGRFFSESDVESTGQPIIITHTLARRLFGNGVAAGRTLQAAGGAVEPFTVVGVTEDMRTVRPAREPDEAVYRISRGEPVQVMVMVRMRADVRDASALIRDAFASAAPGMPVATPEPLMLALNARIGPSLLLARLLSLVSLLAVSLAAVGLYGVVSFAVAERAREIGIRMALGAHTHRVVRLVLRRVALTLGVGIVAGLLGAIVLGRVVEGYLFGVTALEPAVYGAGALLFGIIGLLAALPPLRAATSVDPVRVLRAD